MPEPCPFCGKTEGIGLKYVQGQKALLCFVRCNNCKAQGPLVNCGDIFQFPEEDNEYFHNEYAEYALTLWNERKKT